MRRLALAVLLAALGIGCETKTSVGPVGPGIVSVTRSTSTTTSTTTSTIPPSTKADFIFSPLTPAALEIVSFNAFGSEAAPGRTIVSYSWDFGDGQSKTGVSVTHDFFPQGLYIVTLTVTDSAGEQAKVSKPIGAGVPLPSTTTTSVPTVASAHYVNIQPDPAIPSDLTVIFTLVTAVQTSSAGTRQPGLSGPIDFTLAAVGDSNYTVEGSYSTGAGTKGTITGKLLGTITPAPNGTFTGDFTTTVNGCVSRRPYSGPLSSTALQWTAAGPTTGSCATDPFMFQTLALVQTDAPPTIPTTSTTSSTTTSTSTTTTSTIPPINPGTITVAPSGTGLASATVFTFQFSTQPSGGVPPYTFSWNFGDGSASASGAAPTHVFASPGSFNPSVFVTDSRPVSAQAQAPSMTVGSVTGTWVAQVTSPTRNFDETIAITQTQSAVAASINDLDPVTGAARVAGGSGTVSNPRSLLISLTYKTTPVFSVTFNGSFNDTLATWTGTLFGYGECVSSTSPCNFTATMAPIGAPSPLSAGGGGSNPQSNAASRK